MSLSRGPGEARKGAAQPRITDAQRVAELRKMTGSSLMGAYTHLGHVCIG